MVKTTPSKDMVEIPISDEDYAFFEKIAKEQNLSVEDLMTISILSLAETYSKEFYKREKKKLPEYLRKRLEETENLK
jgi:hypothetical protein